jgi:hypothetical protein
MQCSPEEGAKTLREARDPPCTPCLDPVYSNVDWRSQHNRPMPATSKKVVLRVPAATAKAYEEASPEQKERALSAFARSLRTREEVAREFMAVMDETAREAEARGLTPDILDDILHDRPASPEELAEPDGAG